MSAVPDFTTLDLGTAQPHGTVPEAGEPWLTPEKIPVRPLYTEADLEELEAKMTAAKARDRENQPAKLFELADGGTVFLDEFSESVRTLLYGLEYQAKRNDYEQ